ncbi:hypothetical protein CC78DRAFT_606338 [Lojkania enalia]|uniref:Uncharacterized protein n=1 Tax=Lojkania enalia TaxID=147567 RepID=A0A9P4MYA5_9PLEO|nr:hypothetical protein CC78DRAFT_606338 [Didymosphaeria enalia]
MPKKPKKSSKSSDTHTSSENESESAKPCLTTPDLEFDYDRSQLRDPCPTPGRRAHPRYNSFDIPEDLKRRLESTRTTPKPGKPNSRLNAYQKNQLFRDEGRMNPLHTFHHLYVCHDKGRDASPTYDEADFQLDWDKVDEWMKPNAYNKQRIVRKMDSTAKRLEREEQDMYSLFFAEGAGPREVDNLLVERYPKDQVSKDLGVPWCQIGPQHVNVWRERGFQLVDFRQWWKEPTEEEKKRSMKMLSGASLRKDL